MMMVLVGFDALIREVARMVNDRLFATSLSRMMLRWMGFRAG